MVAVVPVLVGPLQTLLALLPALIVAVGTLLMALFTPRGLKRTARFFWRQKLFSALLLAAGFSLYTGIPFRYLWGGSRAGHADLTGMNGEWPMFRGGALRTGANLGSASPADESPGERDVESSEPASGKLIWNWSAEPTVFSSPAIAVDQVIVTTAGGIGPFSPAGRGAIVSLDADTGRERWRYAPDDFRATFSSPVVAEGRVVSGEGLHLVQDARVTCLDLNGQLQWEFRTQSHVESTPSIADGRVYVGAGDDGFYCLALHEPVGGAPRVMWHLSGEDYPDCESPSLVVEDTVYFGLGDGGHAVCAVDARTGQPRWRVETPYPVFAPATWVPGTLVALSTDSSRAPAANSNPASLARDRLVVAMGNGNFVQSAAELLESRLAVMRDENASESEMADARRRYGPAGSVWILDAATGEKLAEFPVPDTVLGAVAVARDRLVFGARDGHVYAIDWNGKLLARWDAREPIVTSPSIGSTRLFITTITGRLHALDIESFEPTWDTSLGAGTTFLSSPVLARGRLYVGTPDQGVVCVGGRKSPAAYVWSNGEAGGMADHGRLPDSASEQGSIMASDGEPTIVWTPAPVLHGVITACEAGGGTVVTRWPGDDALPSSAAPPLAWRRRLPRLALAPLIAGDRCLLVGVPSANGSAEVHCLSATSGETSWKFTLGKIVPRAATLDASRLYLLGEDTLTCLSLDDGKVEYRESVRVRQPRCLDVSADCVVVAGPRDWQAFDGPTGRALKIESLPSHLTADAADASEELRMRFHNDRLIIAGARVIEALRLTDGQSLWRADVESTGPLALHHGRIARRLVDGSTGVWQVADGAEVLRTEESSDEAPPLLDARHVYVRKGNELLAISLADGATLPWASLTDGTRPAAPLVALGDRLYVLTAAGRCIRLGRPYDKGP